jgi:RWD domain
MTDVENDHNAEEREMESQALEAIFDQQFTMLDANRWSIIVYPETNESDETPNHVGCTVTFKLPDDYPTGSIPIVSVDIIKGLSDEHVTQLEDIANEEANNNLGIPSIYAVIEKIRDWLVDNNVTGLDDISM